MPLLNDLSLADEAFAAARAVVDQEHVATAREPLTASEDSRAFLIHVPGCFVFIGNGEQSAPLHNPLYDFNDELLLRSARFHAAIVSPATTVDLTSQREPGGASHAALCAPQQSHTAVVGLRVINVIFDTPSNVRFTSSFDTNS